MDSYREFLEKAESHLNEPSFDVERRLVSSKRLLLVLATIGWIIASGVPSNVKSFKIIPGVDIEFTFWPGPLIVFIGILIFLSYRHFVQTEIRLQRKRNADISVFKLSWIIEKIDTKANLWIHSLGNGPYQIVDIEPSVDLRDFIETAKLGDEIRVQVKYVDSNSDVAVQKRHRYTINLSIILDDQLYSSFTRELKIRTDESFDDQLEYNLTYLYGFSSALSLIFYGIFRACYYGL